MKKIIFVLAAVASLPNVNAQCAEPVALPYELTSESVIVPALPDCVQSNYNSFSSNEVFETLPGPIAGFDGNVLAYSTAITNEFLPPEAPVNAYLSSPVLQLEQGKNYIISYKYGNSDAQLNIDNLNVYIQGGALGNVDVAAHTNITGATATMFISQPLAVPETGAYQLYFDVMSQGTQGFLYLDDILIEEAAAMGVESTEQLTTVAVYPNPVQNIIHLNNPSAVEAIEIFNVSGQKVHSGDAAPYAAIDMSGFETGVYLLQLRSGNIIDNIKIIKK